MTVLVLALTAGAVVGLALGALGGGGGVLAAPALIYLLGFGPVEATTAGLVVVAVTSATALYGHARDGRVRWTAGALFAAAGAVPAVLTASLADGVPRPVLTLAFAAVAALAALRMLRPAADPDDDARDPAEPPAAEPPARDGPTPGAPRPRPLRAAGAGAGVGALTGFLGVGGGFLAVPALVGMVGLRMRAAVGTSLLVITANALTALVARAGTAAPVDWAVVAPFTGAAVLAAWDGRRLAARVPATALRRIFGSALLAVAALMAVDGTARLL
ncbi:MULTISPECIES: sulfite exporter TauE/SafE family protein [Streptomyces]|uniref:Probable membrane transporter protein n=2 Tax=Streptomyces TaxID=1883 RepID=A0A100Y596_9ACTN|nr:MULTISPECIES: sulfite exporter TauE/SafE family protein [Streptomyces]KUH37947.1 integral membrane family protein [Streptomyces kanasensis]UUS29729.1 sulfite exporter TauE/SafE family protein [Streptomyces changanensis]